MISNNLHKFLHPERNWCIIKLPPINYHDDLDRYYNEGFRQFHVSNTLPTKFGGLSGPELKPYTQRNIQYIRDFYKDTIIIAGGGIRSVKDIKYYKAYGADHFSVSSLCFNPILFLKFYWDFTNQF